MFENITVLEKWIKDFFPTYISKPENFIVFHNINQLQTKIK